MVTPMSCLGIVMQLAVMKMRGLASITASKMSLIVSVNIMSTTSSKRLSFESIYEFCSKILQSFSLIKHSFLFITLLVHITRSIELLRSQAGGTDVSICTSIGIPPTCAPL